MINENNNLENKIIDSDKGIQKKFNILFIFLPVITIVIIGVIILLIVLPKKDNNQDDTYVCEEGEEDKCLKCENNKCISCNYRYNLIDGVCRANYSIKAIYEPVNKEQKVRLIDNSYKYNIIGLEIDNKTMTPDTLYIFKEPGIHFVYISLDISNLTSLSNLFSNAEELTSVNFTKEFDTTNIKSIQSMFYKCTKLVSVDISNFNIQNINSTAYLFYSCSILNTLKLPKTQSPLLERVESMFFGCNLLTSIDFSVFNPTHISNMQNSFF